MLKKLALATAAVGLLMSTASADYYIVQEKATKKCKVVETRPTETTWIQIGPAVQDPIRRGQADQNGLCTEIAAHILWLSLRRGRRCHLATSAAPPSHSSPEQSQIQRVTLRAARPAKEPRAATAMIEIDTRGSRLACHHPN